MALVWLNRLPKPALEARLAAFKTFVFDIEGVIIKEGKPLPGAVEFISYLQHRARVLVFTNSTSARNAWIDKLAAVGLEIPRNNLFTSGYIAAQYAKEHAVKSVYCIGSMGLAKEFEEAGVSVVSASLGDRLSADEAEPRGSVDAVVMGYDPFFNSYKLVTAGFYLRSPSCSLIGTSDKRAFIQDGFEFPAPGTQLRALEHFTRRTASVMMGKPNLYMLSVLRRQHPQFVPQEACMVGDQIDTDMTFAANGGLTGLLVLSGDTTEEQARAHQSALIAPSLGELFSVLSS